MIKQFSGDDQGALTKRSNLTSSDKLGKGGSSRQTPIDSGFKLKTHKRESSGDGTLKKYSIEKKIFRPKNLNGRIFDPKWLRIAFKSKALLCSDMSKKKCVKSKSTKKSETQAGHFKSMSTCRPMDVFFHISRDNEPLTERSPSRTKGRERHWHCNSKRSPQKSCGSLSRKPGESAKKFFKGASNLIVNFNGKSW